MTQTSSTLTERPGITIVDGVMYKNGARVVNPSCQPGWEVTERQVERSAAHNARIDAKGWGL